MDAATWWSRDRDGITVHIRATPGARRSEIVGVGGDRLRVRVHAPAVEGKANTELCRFLAGRFGVRRAAVTIVRGEYTREKSVHLAGVTDLPADLPADR